MRYNTRWEIDMENVAKTHLTFAIQVGLHHSWSLDWHCHPDRGSGDPADCLQVMMSPCNKDDVSRSSWPDDPRYGVSGWLEDLPRLTQGRESHGCGAYTDTQGHRVREHRMIMAGDIMWAQVILVTGGWDGVSRGLDSTEILENNESGWWFNEC